MNTQPSPDELRRMIEEALEEIDRTELEMLDLLSDVLGPQHAQLIAEHIAAQEEAPRFRKLLGKDDPRSPGGDDRQAMDEDRDDL
jgi:hypothetical protein